MSEISEGGDDASGRGVSGTVSHNKQESRECPVGQTLSHLVTSSTRNPALGWVLPEPLCLCLSACHLIVAEVGVGAVMLTPFCRCRNQVTHL